MTCREFRDRHLAFMDGAMSDVELVEMQRHVAECERCERHDTAVRRGLLIFRNLPPIAPSADFSARLNARIRQLHDADARAAMYRGPGVGGFLAAAAGVMAVGLLTVAAFESTEAHQTLSLAPVVATVPAPSSSPMVSHAYVASASAGMSVWPAVMLAEQAPIHLVSTQFREASLGR
jgi:hypothetical protein